MKRLYLILLLTFLLAGVGYSQTLDQIEGTDISTLDQIEGADISTLDQFEGADLPTGPVSNCPGWTVNALFEWSGGHPNGQTWACLLGVDRNYNGTNTGTFSGSGDDTIWQFDNIGDVIEWAVGIADIDMANPVTFCIEYNYTTIPSTGNNGFTEYYGNASNRNVIFIGNDGIPDSHYRFGGATNSRSGTIAISTGVDVTTCQSFNVGSSPDHAVCTEAQCDSPGTWVESSQTLGSWSAIQSPSVLRFGEVSFGSQNVVFSVRNFAVISGYKTSPPAW